MEKRKTKIAVLMEERNITPQQFEQAANLSRSTVDRLIYGRCTGYSEETIHKVCAFFGLKRNKIFGFAPPTKTYTPTQPLKFEAPHNEDAPKEARAFMPELDEIYSIDLSPVRPEVEVGTHRDKKNRPDTISIRYSNRLFIFNANTIIRGMIEIAENDMPECVLDDMNAATIIKYAASIIKYAKGLDNGT